jgi:Rho GDP-dissociation inhibitor
MSLAVGVVSSSKSMGYDEKTNEGEEHSEASKTQTTAKTATDEENAGAPGGLVRRMSESSIYATEEDEDDAERKLELGPQYTLKEQFEKDKVCFCMCLFLSLIK